MYKAILTMNNEDYSGKGDTAIEAMDNIPMTWDKVKAKGIITLKNGKLSAEKLFYLPRLKRIFTSPVTRKFWARNLEYLLGKQ